MKRASILFTTLLGGIALAFGACANKDPEQATSRTVKLYGGFTVIGTWKSTDKPHIYRSEINFIDAETGKPVTIVGGTVVIQ